MSIAYATRLGLGPTNPGLIIIAQETLLFRWTGFSPVCSCYSFQHSHFLTLDQTSRSGFTADRNAPLPLTTKGGQSKVSVIGLIAPLNLPRKIS